jgi:hypothetical protein
MNKRPSIWEKFYGLKMRIALESATMPLIMSPTGRTQTPVPNSYRHSRSGSVLSPFMDDTTHRFDVEMPWRDMEQRVLEQHVLDLMYGPGTTREDVRELSRYPLTFMGRQWGTARKDEYERAHIDRVRNLLWDTWRPFLEVQPDGFLRSQSIVYLGSVWVPATFYGTDWEGRKIHNLMFAPDPKDIRAQLRERRNPKALWS